MEKLKAEIELNSELESKSKSNQKEENDIEMGVIEPMKPPRRKLSVSVATNDDVTTAPLRSRARIVANENDAGRIAGVEIPIEIDAKAHAVSYF